jgi:orotate phosphoribosyltransferase
VTWDGVKERRKREICEVFTRIGALRFGTFELSGGRLSPYYIDLRIALSFPDAFEKIVEIYLEMVEHEVGLDQFKRIAGIPTAGVPFASVLAYKLHKPFVYTRKEAKGYGRGRRVEGILHPGDAVLLVDDLITSGTNLLSAAEAIVAEGGTIHDALVLINREEGGRQALSAQTIRLHELIRITEAVEVLSEMDVITREQLMDVLTQIKK